MLSYYVRWWSEQMRQWLPARLAAPDPIGANAIIIDTEDAEDDAEDDATRMVAITLRRQFRDRPLGSFRLDGAGRRALQAALPARARPSAIVLRLDGRWLLEREVILPLAAERDPGRVLAYEMDRNTPFAAAEVFWTYAITGRDRERGRLILLLSVVTRAAVQPWLDALLQAGLRPGLLEMAGPSGAPRRIGLDRADTGRERMRRRTRAIAASGCAALALAVLIMPFVLQSLASRDVEARIAALRAPVAEAETLRRRIASRAAGTDVIAAERARLGDPLTVLAALTDLLPDDTFLTELTLLQGKLSISGQSPAAARLIAAFSADPVIHNPDFAAPVTRLGGGREVFAIRAEIVR